MMWLYLTLLVASISLVSIQAEMSNDFAVILHEDGDRQVAELLAAAHGFKLVRQLVPLGNVYHFRHEDVCSDSDVGKRRCKRDAEDIAAALRSDPNVLNVEHQEVLEVDKRDFKEDEVLELLRSSILSDKEFNSLNSEVADDELETDLKAYMKSDYWEYQRAVADRHKKVPKFNDPHFGKQWHLENHGQMSGINPGLDLNVAGAWIRNYTGAGVVVTIVDDGIEVKNPDLQNYDQLASTDLNDLHNAEGIPQRKHLTDGQSHGTRCAGELAATANNNFCGVGVAYNCKLGGIRVLDGKVTDLLEAYSLLHNNQYTDISSCSWGPKDNGFAMEMPKYFTQKALVLGVTKGRRGLGSIFVFASGNGGNANDNCGADGFVNSPFTIAAASVNIYGQTTSYGEACSAVHVAAPVGGYHSLKSMRSHSYHDYKVTTTDIHSGCTDRMSGTSAATPLVAGCIALALEANPKLTWRDVQHLLSRSGRIPTPRSRQSWQRNAAGFLVNHHFGFGLLDCSKLVTHAQTWKTVPDQSSCDDIPPFVGHKALRLGKKVIFKFRPKACKISHLEHVQVTVHFQLIRRGDLEIWLVAPSGVKSRLLGTRIRDHFKVATNQTFLSLFSWGESPRGVWTVIVKDTGLSMKNRNQRRNVSRGQVSFVKILFLGTTNKPGPDPDLVGEPQKGSYWLKSDELLKVFAKQRVDAVSATPLHRDTAIVADKLRTDPDLGVKEALNLVKRNDIDESDLRFLLKQLDSELL